MHFTGTIWRPPYEADSLIIEATAGCTHHKCKFCTLYEDLPFKFKATDLSVIENDLIEAQASYYDPWKSIEQRLFELPRKEIDRAFLAGANPFALKPSRLLEIAKLIKLYFPQIRSIGCFARITDVSSKSEHDLAELAQAGFDGLTIGMETGDDEALSFMNKGYRAQDIVTQSQRLHDSGINYAFFYLAGISGKGRGMMGAEATAEICNQTKPWLIGANMLTLYKTSDLFQEMLNGNWQEESEIEKYEEIKGLVANLEIDTEFAMLGASNPVMIQGTLPQHRIQIMDTLDRIIRELGEEKLRTYRENLRHL